MKMPAIKDRAYIKRKLRASFDAGYTDEGLKLFNQAQRRFCVAMGLSLPEVKWRGTLGPRTLGLCQEDGIITLVGAYDWSRGRRSWINTIYHEWGHYYLWADAERKAREFAGKMWRCR